jgi:hypothetical protein
VSDGTAYTQGHSLGSTGINTGPLSATSNGRKIYGLGVAWNIDYSEISGGVLMVSLQGTFDPGSNPHDVAVSDDGATLYTAAGGATNYKCYSIDPTNLSLRGALPGGEAYPNNVEVTSDGRAICGIQGWYSAADFWVHSPVGTLLSSYKVAGYAMNLLDGQMVVTPDGLVVGALTNDPRIAFVPIGPP